MYKQKGTGRARHGSYAAPIFVGGGVAHGPTGQQNYRLALPKKIRRLVLLGALSQKAAEKKVTVLSPTEANLKKTKQANAIRVKSQAKRVLLITGQGQNLLRRAWRNLAGVTILSSNQLHPYFILGCDHLLITSQALEEIKKRYAD